MKSDIVTSRDSLFICLSLRITILTLVLLSGVSICRAWEGNADDTTWRQLKQEVVEKSEQLTDFVMQAQQKGIVSDYAYVSQVVIDRFLRYAQYDKDHPDLVLEAFNGVWWNQKIPDQNYVRNLPFDELQGCLDVADYAINELQKQLNQEVDLLTPVDFKTGKMTLGSGSFLRNGKPVFPSTFTWMPDAEDLQIAFGRMGGIYYALTDINSDGMVNRSAINADIVSVIRQDNNKMAFQQFFIGHRAPNWMIELNPEIEDGGRNFVTYDTDSPIIRNAFNTLFSQYLPEVTSAAGDQQRMHLLANEPNFATRKDGWLAENGVSTYTKERYNNWLIAKYETIELLNQTYATSFRDFGEARDAMLMPIDPLFPQTIQGGPVWYDWCRFNMDRINDWFSFLKNGTQANDPLSAPVTIKVLGSQLSDPWRDEGMDMEYLADLMDVLGADLHVIPSGMTNTNLKENLGWLDHYSLDWLQQSMKLDFYKSLHPDKAFYDSEWHGFSTNRWVDFSMDRNYVRSALWLAFTHGMNAIQSWVWSRKEDSSFNRVNSNFIGEILTQPTALDAYGRVLKELNAHAETITKLANEERQFYIYYCEESAIQDLDYMPDLEHVYEALKLLNVRVGFTTPTKLSNLSPLNQTVVLTPAKYISDQSLLALMIFSKAGGKIIMIDGENQFLKNEHGISRHSKPIIKTYASIESGSQKQLVEELGSILDPIKPDQKVRVLINDLELNPAYGVFAQQFYDEKTKQVVLSLINTSKDKRIVELGVNTGYPVVFTDLITQRNLSATQAMNPYDVLLVRCSLQP